jgi:heme-degrading monooxygenase HmoA
VFRSRVRTDLSSETLKRLAQLGARMYELATGMPGFVSYKDFSSADGESVTIVEFETMEDNLRWRNHPEHAAVQAFGRSEVFAEYNIQVCERVRAVRFP